MRRLRQDSETESHIDISPLIDVVFILLIFFVVTTTFVKDMNLEIERPSAASASLAPSKAVRIYIDSQGQVYIDNQPVRVWMVQSRVRGLLHEGADSVLVVTDEKVPSGRLVEVVDQARLAGAKNVGVATEQEAG
ncbi:biopolymer transport protein ExbD [Methylomarinovum caldicuralii]|uniref:Biopolymer transport protein ExbD n=1 Tax=Methylomarinovum caldicuralii TaxID=438856 RepID=A0AAU9C493_9GAMM|nr:biopolymer transporter ExbD [Methylomarinovum caldicuralii]BCX82558.1 biopolymer transport protein ExbD [Methylomarinovum caldicuralii]